MKKTIDKLCLLLFREGAVMFAREYGNEFAYTIGGERHDGETDLEALKREVLEETSALLDIGSVGHMFTLTGRGHGKPGGTLVRLSCFTGTLDREPVPSGEVEELMLLYADDGHLTTEIGNVILDRLHERGLIIKRADRPKQ